MTAKERIEQRGEHTVKFCDNGSYRISRIGPNGKDAYVPSDIALKARYRREIRELGSPSSTTRQYLNRRGLIESGKASITKGRESLGLRLKRIKTKKGYVHRVSTLDEVEKAIRSAWPPLVVESILAGNTPEEILTITDFRHQYSRPWNLAHRTYGKKTDGKPGDGLRKVMERVYPGLYDRIARRKLHRAVNVSGLKSKLIGRFNLGQPICEYGLLDSGDREEHELALDIAYLRKRVHLLSQEESQSTFLEDSPPKGKRISFDTVVEKVTGLKKSEFQWDSSSSNNHAVLAEAMTHFFLVWAEVTGLPQRTLPTSAPEKLDNSEIRANRAFKYQLKGEEKSAEADLRRLNDAIEVKTGRSHAKPANLEDLLARYTPRTNHWNTGESMDETYIFFHKPKGSYRQIQRPLEKAGITVIEPQWFGSKLEKLVDLMKRNHSGDLEEINPRPTDFNYLLELYGWISERPDILLRKRNKALRKWSLDILKALILKGYELL